MSQNANILDALFEVPQDEAFSRQGKIPNENFHMDRKVLPF